MFRRSVIAAVALVVAAVAVPSALGVRVSVRVEGKTQTIFGATEPAFDVEPGNALAALERASVAGEFYYHVAESSFGRYVDQIGRYAPVGQTGWVFKVNGESPPVGADAVELRRGDRVLWYWAQFGVAGGPETLLLRKLPRSCYRVTAQNDRGVERAAVGATLQVDGRRVRTHAGRACIGPHRGLVRATLGGAVRSNAVR